ncbi:MAG: hypothetical protein M0Q49_01820 [Porticoccaceae bacterium]|nr:hypothetical protein [Porticoccaceae bacterium]
MKMRVWGGRPTLATEQGKQLKSFEEFEAWATKQPDGQIEVWAGRWWAVGKEARPFVVQDGKLFCAYGPYRSKQGLDPADHSGFFAYEAWKVAKRLHEMWSGIGKMAEEIVDGQKK